MAIVEFVLMGAGVLYFFSLLNKLKNYIKEKSKNPDNLTEIDHEYLKILYKGLESYRYKNNWNDLYNLKRILNFSNYDVLFHLGNNNCLTICFLKGRFDCHSCISHEQLLTDKCRHKIILSPHNPWYKAIYNLYYLDFQIEKKKFIIDNKNDE